MFDLDKRLKAIRLGFLVASVGVLSHSCGDDGTTNPKNTAPVAQFMITPSSGTGQTVFQFDASGCSDAEDATSALAVRWDWENDGTWDTSHQTTKTATHQYETAGTKTVKLQVRDTGGMTGETTRSVTVSETNTAPTASFTVNPLSGTTETDFQFDASGCIDAEDAASALEVRWDWENDGTWDASYSTTKMATHRYATTGTKTIKLEVRDTEGLTGETTRSVSVGGAPTILDMVLIIAGTFTMGDGVADCGVDEREVTLTRDFYLGQHEVTNQEYMEAVQWAYDNAYVTATTTSVQDNLDGSTQELLDLNSENCEIQFDGVGTFFLRESPSLDAQYAYPGGYDPSNHPVVEVTWYGAVRFCDWLSMQAGLGRAYEHTGDWMCNGGDPYGAEGYRLPTDAEWEYAAQYDDGRIYPWGNGEPNCSRGNFLQPQPSYCVRWTTPVGSYSDAPASLRLSDMAGNVWEWCNDWFVCSLGTSSVPDPTGPGSATHRVLRGMSWACCGDPMCAFRYPSNPAAGRKDIGVRIAKTLGP